MAPQQANCKRPTANPKQKAACVGKNMGSNAMAVQQQDAAQNKDIDGNKENASGCPPRKNKGQNTTGRLAQSMKIDAMQQSNTRKRGRMLLDAPDDLVENDMAPPRPKRAKSKQVLPAPSDVMTPLVPDKPLQLPPQAIQQAHPDKNTSRFGFWVPNMMPVVSSQISQRREVTKPLTGHLAPTGMVQGHSQQISSFGEEQDNLGSCRGNRHASVITRNGHIQRTYAREVPDATSAVPGRFSRKPQAIEPLIENPAPTTGAVQEGHSQQLSSFGDKQDNPGCHGGNEHVSDIIRIQHTYARGVQRDLAKNRNISRAQSGAANNFNASTLVLGENMYGTKVYDLDRDDANAGEEDGFYNENAFEYTGSPYNGNDDGNGGEDYESGNDDNDEYEPSHANHGDEAETDHDSEAGGNNGKFYDGQQDNGDDGGFPMESQDGTAFIDEMSPSEDEQNAALNLRSETKNQGPADEGNEMNNPDSFDVVQQHYKHNRVVRQPNPQRLTTAAIRQSNNAATSGGHDQDDNDSSGGDDDNDNNNGNNGNDGNGNGELAKKRAACNSKKNPGPAKPDMLAYYPPGWKAMLMKAKENYRRYIALEHAFPNRMQHLKDTNHIIARTRAQCEADGLILEDGYSHNRFMDVLVFKEGSTFRNTLKDPARSVVDENYNITPSFEEFSCGNQEASYVITRAKVADLLNDGQFQRDGKDDNGQTNNLAHPAIGKLIAKIFYSGPESLGIRFPDDFKDSVPDHAIALAITCLQFALEEYQNGYRQEAEFKGEVYKHVMRTTLAAIKQVKSNAYHGSKFEDNCRKWAHFGMSLNDTNKLGPLLRNTIQLILD